MFLSNCSRVIWILLVVLTVLGGVAAVGIAANERKKLPAANAQKQLGAGERSRERTIAEVRVDDIVTIDHKDYVCEGTIAYDEDGHRWVGGRCVDNTVVKWLVVGLERTGAGATRLLDQWPPAHAR